MDQNAALHTSILAGFIHIKLIKLDLKTFGLVTCMLIEHRGPPSFSLILLAIRGLAEWSFTHRITSMSLELPP